MEKIVKNHKELAKIIEGKTVLHLNSLGKDSAVCLEWLSVFAKPSKIVSLNFKFMASHPNDAAYMEWQKERYSEVEFLQTPNTFEISKICEGIYQDPLTMMRVINEFEYETFNFHKVYEEICKKYELDFICLGMSKYESVTRASILHKKGILQGNKIYPLGMMSKAEIIGLIKTRNIKLHPCYKFTGSTYDFPSYYKMRSSFIAKPEFKEKMFQLFPLLALDEFRYEVLLKKDKKNEM